ncbi:Lysophospholipase L1 [Actinacidiphila yanglinensis]|uniref:Lysophospholipase L1 n=1 Tax=Actinacidiphila yanglinensis TaxID=310779 RepID=A0A1H6EDH7_9ACTN|nr:GDSL-type esterase/lipase family protein [Actinacidiphila yanglinensis]SEG95311.1 Lysophospholipase L1 [Actinacidiphila yanglinensis]
MSIRLGDAARVLFQGDSITDASRDREDDAGLGNGYVSLIAGRLAADGSGRKVLNRGISGNRVVDLRARWQEDALDLAPDLLSVMIGVNDTWRRYDANEITTIEDYERDYRFILEQARAIGAQLVLIEPFLVPVDDEQWTWREDLDGRIHVVRRLAADFDAALLAADGLLNQAAREAGSPAAIADDGVHLTPAGHACLAAAWEKLVGVEPVTAPHEPELSANTPS